ncbi:hypothetical protein C4F49_03615 [Sphingobacterium sp. KB22]|uniref:Uncharacterized protein n=1 Tax=Sphingobacterium hungaricum TaxID=2082723 RepID=A0A928UX76_9SPHI|nr:hypothetical protein [Sphingobacterium hungaricum]
MSDLWQTKSVLQGSQVCEFRLIEIADILKELSGNHVAKCFSLHTKPVTSQNLSDLLQGSELQNSDLYMSSLPCIFSFNILSPGCGSTVGYACR